MIKGYGLNAGFGATFTPRSVVVFFCGLSSGGAEAWEHAVGHESRGVGLMFHPEHSATDQSRPHKAQQFLRYMWEASRAKQNSYVVDQSEKRSWQEFKCCCKGFLSGSYNQSSNSWCGDSPHCPEFNPDQSWPVLRSWFTQWHHTVSHKGSIFIGRAFSASLHRSD